MFRSGKQPEEKYFATLEKAAQLLPHINALLGHANHVGYSRGRGMLRSTSASALVSVPLEHSRRLRANVAYTYELRGQYSKAKVFYQSLVSKE